MDNKAVMSKLTSERIALSLRLQSATLEFEAACITSNETMKTRWRAEIHTLQDMSCDNLEQIYYFAHKTI